MSDLKRLKTNHIPASNGQAHPIAGKLEECLRERNTALAQLFELQTESEVLATGLQARLEQAEEAANEERTAHFAELEQLRRALAERDTQIVALQQHVGECDCAVESLRHGLAKLDQERQSLDGELVECRTRIAEQEQALAARDRQIARLHASTSWRITAPLRYVAANRQRFGSYAADWLRAIYLALPLPGTLKLRIKGFIFALLSPLLRRTAAYRAWIEFEQNRRPQVQSKRWRNRLRAVIAEWARAIYVITPLPVTLKVRLKGGLLALFSPLVRHTRAYKDWVVFVGTNPNNPNATALSKIIPPGQAQPNEGSAEHSITRSHEESSQFTPTDSGIAEPDAPAVGAQTASRGEAVAPPKPVPSAVAALRNADGHFEWEDYTTTKARIREIERTRRDSLTPEAPPLIDIAKEDLRSAASRIALPVRGAHPEVSIIIPTYNQAKLTIECLLSISAHTDPATKFEVLLADDKSTDETATILRTVPHLRIITSKRNQGFLQNCNDAAKRAKGELLLFLNNDTQVRSGWLTELVKTLRDSHDCAAVGPKLIYPNGYLQEAGASLRRDCTTQMVGLDDGPNLLRYNYTRDVDYCSGASLLVKASVFRELGGFDECYAPAYCEDADLCLRIRQAGYRVLYCPRSVVVHHLSKTSNTVRNDYKLGCIVKNLHTFSRRWQAVIDERDEARLIAFYLPQFHPIPENDVWWGKGFTEWMNVTRAKPNFAGHYQPHLPADLGYYDLRVADVMDHQARLAKRYGIHGFCFYYYWFAGRRVLELPLERLLETGRPDIPFCLCWANENWTRRWDGMDHEILVAQQHSEEDDLAVIKDLCRFFAKPKYIRVGGKPLILVYRVTLFPDFATTAALWRQYCRDAGIGEIYIAMVESFELVHVEAPPSRFGCDAAVEFPPLGMGEPKPPEGEILNERFTGYIADYRDVAVRYATRPYPGYKRFLGVMPGWDNTPRRQDNGFIFDRSTPGTFQAWLERALQTTKEQFVGEERLVFLNAWNEWAEGAHLEPDQRFGHTFLEAVLNAKQASSLLRHDRYTLG